MVDRAALEMRSTGNRTGGSNPSLSAKEMAYALTQVEIPAIIEVLTRPTILEGPANPDNPSDPGVRWDWRTGRGCGIEFD